MYEVEAFKERFWSGTINPNRLAEVLNSRAQAGWRYRHTITAGRRVLLMFKRDTHFLIFEQGAAPAAG